jgi:hypothetical protein
MVAVLGPNEALPYHIHTYKQEVKEKITVCVVSLKYTDVSVECTTSIYKGE